MEKEIRWSHIWSVEAYRRTGRPIPREKPFSFLEPYTTEALVAFVTDCLSIVAGLPCTRVILTVTPNRHYRGQSDSRLYEMHLQDTMQRIEMESDEAGACLVTLFLDTVSPAVDRCLQDFYNRLQRTGDLIRTYSHVHDCLGISQSHQCTGVQIADYIAGIADGCLKGFEPSRSLFRDFVRPILRKSRSGRIMGFGAMEVPTNPTTRREVEDLLGLGAP